MENGKSVPNVTSVRDIGAGILGAPPTPMSINEIVWSRRSALCSANFRDSTQAQQNALLEGIMTWGEAHRCHVTLATESGEPAGSGICVKSGGQRGILTARHVLYADGEIKERQSQLLIGFAPPQSVMLEAHRRRQYGQRESGKPLGPFRVTFISIGDRATIVPLQRKDKIYADPGLPDIAIIVVSDDIEERLREAARAEGTAAPEPRWVNLDSEDLVSIPYGPTNEDDEMLKGSWLITGLRGERSNFTKFYSEMDEVVIDRIYRRSEYEYYGIFVDEEGGRRVQSRGWKGTSGGGVWQQRFTQSGRRKIEQNLPRCLTPEDLEPPVLGGIAFFHETRKSPQELRGDLDGMRRYRGELYAHRIGGMLLGLIRGALRHGVKMADMGERERASEAAGEQGGS